MRTVLVTGGAGFIGSAFVRLMLKTGYRVVVLDALTYAGHNENLSEVAKQITFVHGNICDARLLASLFAEHRFNWVVNFAAESHVDRSIDSAADFVTTNVLGVFTLLEAARRYWQILPAEEKNKFRLLQVSTDEVFGSLGEQGKFSEKSQYQPNSPYSASKASGDHFARAWFHTYGLPVLVSNCSNNYGPRQFPEKLIPHMIRLAIEGKPLPVYGTGQNVRDWIHVDDHCEGIRLALERGKPGESYCFGGNSERRNLDVVNAICNKLDRAMPRPDGKSYSQQISFVEDRKGHDWRYAIDDQHATRELGFQRRYKEFEEGLEATLRWYLDNRSWISAVMTRAMVKS
jgi:dTDP-glucose 4,6-dehydratase